MDGTDHAAADMQQAVPAQRKQRPASAAVTRPRLAAVSRPATAAPARPPARTAPPAAGSLARRLSSDKPSHSHLTTSLDSHETAPDTLPGDGAQQERKARRSSDRDAKKDGAGGSSVQGPKLMRGSSLASRQAGTGSGSHAGAAQLGSVVLVSTPCKAGAAAGQLEAAGVGGGGSSRVAVLMRGVNSTWRARQGEVQGPGTGAAAASLLPEMAFTVSPLAAKRSSSYDGAVQW
jgi:hypothetical protein